MVNVKLTREQVIALRELVGDLHTGDYLFWVAVYNTLENAAIEAELVSA